MLRLLSSDDAYADVDALNWLRCLLLNPGMAGVGVDLGEAERRAILADLDADLRVLLED